MQFFIWLQDTPFAHWVASDPSLLAYPTILTLHTVGMAIVVGTCVGHRSAARSASAGDVPLAALARRAAARVDRLSHQRGDRSRAVHDGRGAQGGADGLLREAVADLSRARPSTRDSGQLVFRTASPQLSPISERGESAAAILSLILWTGATVAGRLMAYLL